MAGFLLCSLSAGPEGVQEPALRTSHPVPAARLWVDRYRPAARLARTSIPPEVEPAASARAKYSAQVECSNCHNTGWVCGEHKSRRRCKSELAPIRRVIAISTRNPRRPGPHFTVAGPRPSTGVAALDPRRARLYERVSEYRTSGTAGTTHRGESIKRLVRS
jgi:hypothetical protein